MCTAGIPAVAQYRPSARFADAGSRRSRSPMRRVTVTAFVEIDNVTHAYGGTGGVIAVDKLTLCRSTRASSPPSSARPAAASRP